MDQAKTERLLLSWSFRRFYDDANRIARLDGEIGSLLQRRTGELKDRWDAELEKITGEDDRYFMAERYGEELQEWEKALRVCQP